MPAFHPTQRALEESTKKSIKEEPRLITLQELEEHNDPDGAGAWVALCGYVYDLGPFFEGEKKHPAGLKILTKYLGKDATSSFLSFHYPSGRAVQWAPGMLVGKLAVPRARDDSDDEEE